MTDRRFNWQQKYEQAVEERDALLHDVQGALTWQKYARRHILAFAEWWETADPYDCNGTIEAIDTLLADLGVQDAPEA